MAETTHIFAPQQAEFLRALRDGHYRAPARRGRPKATLPGSMPPIYQQALRGTCVANAVTALLEYYDDCRTRLSVQFLFAATKEVEREALERNLAALRTGGRLDAGFEAACHAGLMQLRMLADANGGMDSPAVRPFLARFEERCRTLLAETPGSLLQSCFRAVETRGVCRNALWPYAVASATPVFGRAGAEVFPPGSREDAAKRRVVSGLYLLASPNNVDEIRGILAGNNGRRPMPVAVTVEFFEGCDGGTYAFPGYEEGADGRLISRNASQGRHGLLIVGYDDDPEYEGGGYFTVRNSLGEDWGEQGYGRLPYAYIECFALEAGTILQDLIDYQGDGYEGMFRPPPKDWRAPEGGASVPGTGKSRWMLPVNLAIALALVVGTWCLARWHSGADGAERRREPYAEVTIYGRGGVNEKGVLPPWNVKGVPVDGGYVYRIPAVGQAARDEVRTVLGEMETLHEKRGKPFTYDVVSIFRLRGDQGVDARGIVARYMGDGFPVRIIREQDGDLVVGTLNPVGFTHKLERDAGAIREQDGVLRLHSVR